MDNRLRVSVFKSIRAVLNARCIGHSADEIAAILEKELPEALSDKMFTALLQTLVGEGLLLAIGKCSSKTGVVAITYKWIDKPPGYSYHSDLFLTCAVNYALMHPCISVVSRKLETIF
jgi:hypothetical protein